MPPAELELLLADDVDIADEESPLLFRENPLIAIFESRLHGLIDLLTFPVSSKVTGILSANGGKEEDPRQVAKIHARP